ncbi:LLM class flavin-dependent oxidoreductase [Roseovarius sp. LXJ103]|uniref:MupA/Atu3671 family FMN-dependent luciferase-like monooxygenase n=1 Tax=Roseovarius carneus TaxID=2853164 RepID=UPI000D614A60|nr:MupA/Atu3671 family FMN-dependent luciferase-like monooxygenase [Roseovarius carneus]MBZ8119286.1 LLM class flavin-dependent oxidoreductase [Roseovarius carneus]PWE35093.1 peptide synthetase [Pelagicola sp. LXJ1103]
MSQFSCVLIGSETLTLTVAEMLVEAGVDLRAVCTRHGGLQAWAEARGIAVGGDLWVLDVPHDWLISAANLRILPEAVIARAARGAVNFHDGPLPDYAGVNTPVWALLNGAAAYGITWHHMAGGVDKGHILLQRWFDIAVGETAHSLNARCYAEAVDSFGEVITELASDRPAALPQEGPGLYLGLADLPPAAGHLDFGGPAQTALHLVEALDFANHANPICAAKLELGGHVLAAGSAEMLGGRGAPGTVLEVSDEALVVMADGGALRLGDLRYMDGRRVDPSALVAQGDVLHLPARAVTAGARLAKLAPAEALWRRRLEAELLGVPLAGPRSAAPDWQRVEISVPDGTSLEDIAARFLEFAERSAGARGAVALQTSELATLLDGAEGYITPWVPMVAVADIAVAQSRPGFAADLMLRTPALAGRGQPDLALSLSGAPVPGCALSFLPHEAALIYDAARLSADAATLLTARLEEALRGPLVALPEADRVAITAWNDTCVAYDATLTMPRAFEAQVARMPAATALIFEDTALSYGDLNARANHVAAALQAAGVGPGVTVALMAARGFDLMIGALGILKAGGAYVPLDPEYPAARTAHCIADSAAPVILTQEALRGSLPATQATVLTFETLQGHREANPETGAGPDDLAYLIYTSGSTGAPKGVMVGHRNVANFCAAMDAHITRTPGDTWLAVTSLAFDISVLELFYTLTRGMRVVISGDGPRAAVSGTSTLGSDRGMDFGLYYWGNDDGVGAQKYHLLLEGARFAEAHGFTSLWTPERHFHAFGGPYPNPSVTGAAVAAVAPGLSVRGGSCVAPLHHPARIAEEWAVIDNLTNGGAGIAFASGWQPDDFILRPENTPPENKPALYETLKTVRKLWRGEEVAFPTATGGTHSVVTQPRPVSKELPVWVTTAGNPETWREAGALEANVLTHLLGQSIEEVGTKIALYYAALREAGHDPADFKVTMMLHTYLAETRDKAREVAREPMKDYLRSAAGLIKQYAWAFPAFKRPKGVSTPFEMDLGSLEADELEAILDFAFERYFEDAGLFGTVEDAAARTEQLKAIGVDEIACLIDYGIAPEVVMEGLKPLAEVLRRANAGAALDPDDFSIAAQIMRHGVTHMQCTPSMARLLTMDRDARRALARVEQLYVGGEALPQDLAVELRSAGPRDIRNMYGPTETTIWSSVDRVGDGPVSIGTPIANTTLHVLDEAGREVPVGVQGALWIGGAGVTQGYWQREALTAERFRSLDGVGQGVLYDTGDLAAWQADGRMAYLGRADTQVKIRGQRMEMGEIEACLKAHEHVTEAVVMARPGPTGDPRLVGYFTASAALAEPDLRAHLAKHLPAAMIPAVLVPLDTFPLTPNKKIDRNALASPEAVAPPVPKAEAEMPASDMGQVVLRVWQTVLSLPQIGARDNFFDLGGHSLLAVQVHRDLRTALPDTRLTITDIFRFPVLADLVAHMETGGIKPAAAVAPTPDAPGRSATMSKRRAMRAGREARP